MGFHALNNDAALLKEVQIVRFGSDYSQTSLGPAESGKPCINQGDKSNKRRRGFTDTKRPGLCV